MKSTWKLPNLIYRKTMLKLNQVNSNHTADYDKAAVSYDDYYSQNLGKSALEMLQKIPVQEDNYVLDLACGTGYFTHRLSRKVGSNGKVDAVDLSFGMLQRNKEIAAEKGLSNITFVQSDALSFLSNLSNNSVDGIVCGWGICYMEHDKFLRELERVLKTGGFVGIIENKASSLKEVSNIYTKALIEYPKALIKNININLPKNKNYLVNKFRQRSFYILDTWEGQVTINCQNGQQIADYITKSGASAGFLDALDKELRPQVMQSFVKYADDSFAKGRAVPVVHEYCVLIATKL